jgi:hypothetical protein
MIELEPKEQRRCLRSWINSDNAGVRGLIMAAARSVIFLLLLVLVPAAAQQEERRQDSAFPVLSGPYLGQKPPGETAELFAPGVVSTCTQHSGACFTPDAREVYFSRMDTILRTTAVMFMAEVDSRWTPPRVLCEGLTPGLSPDGRRLVFSRSFRTGGGPIWRLYASQREGDGWSEPTELGAEINFARRQDMPSISRDGTLYYCSQFGRDEGIYYAEYKNGDYVVPKKVLVGPAAKHISGTPGIAPDGSYLVFSSFDYPGLGMSDLFVCFQETGGAWSEPRNLGSDVNSSAKEAFGVISPDGKYLFFMSNRVSALKSRSPTVLGTSTGCRQASLSGSAAAESRLPGPSSSRAAG